MSALIRCDNCGQEQPEDKTVGWIRAEWTQHVAVSVADRLAWERREKSADLCTPECASAFFTDETMEQKREGE